MAICRCWNAQLSLSQRASAGLLGGLLCGGWQRDSRIPAIEASRARFESIRAILVGGWAGLCGFRQRPNRQNLRLIVVMVVVIVGVVMELAVEVFETPLALT